jgi:prolyl oligopeptidase
VKSAPEKFDATGLVVEQHEATSADGTKIPYFLVRRADAPRDGTTPTLLHGYGGFQLSQLPGYNAVRGKLWLERGGAYAVANTRGGGEFGPAWHQAAIGPNRDRAHEDFIAVAEDLVAKRFTSPQRLGIQGGSQGGLFMGVAMTRRPDLFSAVIIGVPLFDMLRYHKLLAGASWIGEYGDPEIPEQRAWIERYSPYQALAAGKSYPEPFIFTSTKDDRVHPGHARKAAAKLESLGYPYLYYENIDGGHSAAANLAESARRNALEYTYLTRKLMDSK